MSTLDASSVQLEVYTDDISQPCRALKLYLLHTGYPFIEHSIDLFKGENLQPPVCDLTPFKKVPIAVFCNREHSPDGRNSDTNGSSESGLQKRFVLGESVSIMRLVDRLRRQNIPPEEQCNDESSSENLWYPADPFVRAKVDEMCDYHLGTVRIGAITVFYHGLLYPLLSRDLLGHMAKKSSLEQGLEILNNSLSLLEKVLSISRYVAGTSHPTFADLLISEELLQLRLLPQPPHSVSMHLDSFIGETSGDTQPLPPLDIAKDYPHVHKWIERMDQLEHLDDVRKRYQTVEKSLHPTRMDPKMDPKM